MCACVCVCVCVIVVQMYTIVDNYMEFEPDKRIINSLLDVNMYIMYNLDHKSLSLSLCLCTMYNT